MRLAQRAQSAIYWNTGFNLFRDVLQFGVMLVLVRLLDPSDYGKFGLATQVIGMISVFAFHNIVSHVLQIRDPKRVNYQLHFTAGMLIQTGLFGLTHIIACGSSYAAAYRDIAPLLHLLSIVFLLECPCELRRKMLERELDWRRLRTLHGIGLLGSALLSVALALLGFGVYALILPGMLVTIPFAFDLFVMQKWRPTWERQFGALRPAMRFGLARLGSAAAVRSRTLIEAAVLAQLLGFAGVGVFGRAMGLGTMCCQKLALQLMYAIYPVLTKMEPDSAQFRHTSGLVLRLVAWLTVPLALLLAYLSAPIVHTVYGDTWVEVMPLLPWAMCGAAVGAMTHVVYMLMLAKDEQNHCLILDGVFLAANLGLLFWVLPSGLLVYMKGLCFIQLVIFVLAVLELLKTNGVEARELFFALFPAVAGSIAALFTSIGVFSLLGVEASKILPALCFSLCFSCLYMLILRAYFTQSLIRLIDHFPAKKALFKIMHLKLNL